MSYSSTGVTPPTQQSGRPAPSDPGPAFSFSSQSSSRGPAPAPRPPAPRAPAAAVPAAAKAAGSEAAEPSPLRRWRLLLLLLGCALAAGAVGGALLLSGSPDEELGGLVAVPAAVSPAASAVPGSAPTAAPVAGPGQVVTAPDDGRNVFMPLYSGSSGASGASGASGGVPAAPDGTSSTASPTASAAPGGSAPAANSLSVEWRGPSPDGAGQLFQVVQGGQTSALVVAVGEPLGSSAPLSWLTVVNGSDATTLGLVAGAKLYTLAQGTPLTLS